MVNSKNKGKRGELELVHELKARGYDVRRTAQYCGNTGDASDLVGIPNIHIECKVREKHNIYDYIAQVDRDKKDDELGCVFIKSNRKKWLVLMDLDDWETLHRGIYKKIRNNACGEPQRCEDCKYADWNDIITDNAPEPEVNGCEIKDRFNNNDFCRFDERIEEDE